jgi:hypothetical protein
MAFLKSLQRLQGLKTMSSNGVSSVRQTPVGRGLLDSVSALLEIVRMATYYRLSRARDSRYI